MTRVTECICKDGYWRPDGLRGLTNDFGFHVCVPCLSPLLHQLAGEVCLPCPRGAACEYGLVLPAGIEMLPPYPATAEMFQDGSPRWAQATLVEQARPAYKKSHFCSIGSLGVAYMCRPEFGDAVQSLNVGLREFKKSAEYTALCARYPSIDCDPNNAEWQNAKTIHTPKAADHPTSRADIVIGTEADFGEYNYIEDGELKGFDIELTKAVCKAAGKVCAIVTVPWQSVWPKGYPEFGWDTNPKLYPGIGTNSAWFHCTSGTRNTIARQQSTAFSNSYTLKDDAGFVSAKSLQITADAEGKKVAVLDGWAATDFFRQNSGVAKRFHPSSIIGLQNSIDLWTKLETGAIDAVYTESSKVDEYLRRRSNPESLPYFFANGVRYSAAKMLDGYPFEGNITSAGDEWHLPDGRHLPEIFMSCGDRCKGGLNFECADERAGQICSQCAHGYGLIANNCHKCFDDYRNVLAAIFGISAVVCGMLLNKLTAGIYDALDILLAYTQVLAIVQVSTTV